ncbi:MAG: transposase, partial [Cytophagales bacterium]|nr:transposase [Cytophagales bacterium]
CSKKVSFSTVLMDTWYATVTIMYTIHEYGKIFYCPIKSNRLVSGVDHQYHPIPVKDLEWCEEDLPCGQRVHLWKMHKNFHVPLFRISATGRTDFVVTHDLSQNSSHSVQIAYAMRWKVEELPRELKQTTGIECCQCRKHRIQRTHLACAFLVWGRLKNLAYKMKTTIYAVKSKLLDNYMRQQLCSPTISMSGFA